MIHIKEFEQWKNETEIASVLKEMYNPADIRAAHLCMRDRQAQRKACEYWGITPQEFKQRKCLRCRRMFDSLSTENRRCGKCESHLKLTGHL